MLLNYSLKSPALLQPSLGILLGLSLVILLFLFFIILTFMTISCTGLIKYFPDTDSEIYIFLKIFENIIFSARLSVIVVIAVVWFLFSAFKRVYK